MCGLVVAMGDLYSKDVSKFLDLLEASAIRGKDATGVAGIHKTNVKVFKDTVSSWVFTTKHYKDINKTIDNTCMAIFGHTRAATTGTYGRDSAHPFTLDKIVGMHNGVISDSNLKALPYKTNYPTDSEQVLASIAHSGVEATFKYLQGDWAFVWFNRNDDRVYFTRNKGRSLYSATSEDGKRMWLGSELGMLKWILERQSTDKYNYAVVEENALYSIKVTNKGIYDLVKVPLEHGKPQAYLYKPPEKEKTQTPTWAPSKDSLAVGEVLKGPSSTVIQPSMVPVSMKDLIIEDVPILTAEEIREMGISTLHTYKERIEVAINTLKRRYNNIHMLSDVNFSDRVTWRGNTKSFVERTLKQTAKAEEDIIRLGSLKSNVQARIDTYNRLKENLEARKYAEEAEKLRKLQDTPISPAPNVDLGAFKTLADAFPDHGSFNEFFNVLHPHGCANCGCSDPTQFQVAKSIRLQGQKGYVCSTCAEYDDVKKDILEPYAERA